MNASPNNNKGFSVGTSFARFTRRSIRNSILSIALAAMGIPAAHAYTPSLTPSVTTASGTYSQLQGVYDSYSTLSFRGIPYAKPPTGSLRWKAPQDPNAWSAGAYGSSFGSQCAQIGNFFDGVGNPNNFPTSTFPGNLVGSENCLFVNVWRPNNSNDNLPIVYWIHGGSNYKGTAKDPTFNGARFASRNNVIVVSVQYRLGLLGWLYQSAIQVPNASTAYDKQSNSGNFALLDIMKGLDWARANAATFGGNVNNVTIMGESAGCINVWGVIQSPLAANKFQRAICMSGFPNDNDPGLYGQPAANDLVNRILIDNSGGTLTWSQADSQRQSMTASQISSLLYNATPYQVMRFTPKPDVPTHFMDGTVLPSSVLGLPQLFSCNYNHVPIMYGSTKDEGSYFLQAVGPLLPSNDQAFIVNQPTLWNMVNSGSTSYTEGDIVGSGWTYTAWLANPFPTNTGLLYPVEKFTSTHKTITAGIDYTIDNVMRYLNTTCGTTFYRYNFNWLNTPAPWNQVLGTMHAMDVPFAFGNFVTSVPDFFHFAWTSSNVTDREGLSAVMNKYFGNFVTSGSPNSPQTVPTQWTTWTSINLLNKRMIFDYSGSTNTSGMSGNDYYFFTPDYTYMTLAAGFPYFWTDAKTAIDGALVFTALPPAVNPYNNYYK